MSDFNEDVGAKLNAAFSRLVLSRDPTTPGKDEHSDDTVSLDDESSASSGDDFDADSDNEIGFESVDELRSPSPPPASSNVRKDFGIRFDPDSPEYGLDVLKGDHGCYFSVYFNDCKFDQSSIRRTVFKSCVLFNVTFNNCDFSNIKFENVVLREVRFEGCKFENGDYHNWAPSLGEIVVGKTFNEFPDDDVLPKDIRDKSWIRDQKLAEEGFAAAPRPKKVEPRQPTTVVLPQSSPGYNDGQVYNDPPTFRKNANGINPYVLSKWT